MSLKSIETQTKKKARKSQSKLNKTENKHGVDKHRFGMRQVESRKQQRTWRREDEERKPRSTLNEGGVKRGTRKGSNIKLNLYLKERKKESLKREYVVGEFLSGFHEKFGYKKKKFVSDFQCLDYCTCFLCFF